VAQGARRGMQVGSAFPVYAANDIRPRSVGVRLSRPVIAVVLLLAFLNETLWFVVPRP